MSNNRRRLQLLQAGGGGGTTVYVEEDFTATTTGDLVTDNLTTDELGGGWIATDFVLASWDYNASGLGVEYTGADSAGAVIIQTDGREDVQVTCEYIAHRNGANSFTLGPWIRGTGVGRYNALAAKLVGSDTDLDIWLQDDSSWVSSSVNLIAWDMSVLAETIAEGDTVRQVMRCSGNDITLYSVQVNGGTVHTIDDTYTLTGAVATTHGAGSGADYYGWCGRNQTSAAKVLYYKVESLP